MALDRKPVQHLLAGNLVQPAVRIVGFLNCSTPKDTMQVLCHSYLGVNLLENYELPETEHEACCPMTGAVP